ncbi:hypothetical protein ACT3OH_05420 [Vreelandella zhanjiangensis]|uniref:hypothetical protein n=1 Tax=Vreelandella zhanjiangensis TaxID=1121960 RepID=UPI00402AF1C3
MNEVKFLVALVKLIFKRQTIVKGEIEKAALLVIDEYKQNPDASEKCYPDIIRRRGKTFIGWKRKTWRNDGRFEIVRATYDKKAIGANVLIYENENQKRAIEKAEKKLRKLRECLNMIEQHQRDYNLIISRVRKIHDTKADNND